MSTAAERPAVSIVMPTLNQAGFIAESVDSVMAQGVDGLELVVSDGGSTDGTLSELAGLAARYPGRLRWTSGPDAGPADAVNAAVARAAAPIVGWLNSDDLYAPGAVRRALEHFAAHPDDVMVYGEADHVDEHGARIERYPSRGPETPMSEYADGCHVCQPSAFFRREAFDALGGLDTRLRAAFDYDFWLRLSREGPIAKLAKVGVLYRTLPGSVSRTPRATNFEYEVLKRAVQRWGLVGPDGSTADAAALDRRLEGLQLAHAHSHLHHGDPRVAWQVYRGAIARHPANLRLWANAARAAAKTWRQASNAG
jgi:glycosyltransferase involved in cell wall biosynthesis